MVAKESKKSTAGIPQFTQRDYGSFFLAGQWILA
jgi:hypothetical protein